MADRALMRASSDAEAVEYARMESIADAELTSALETERSKCLEKRKLHEAQWTSKAEKLDLEIKMLDDRLDAVSKPTASAPADDEIDGLQPPGPACLRWVEGPWFSLACGLVVLLNMVDMCLQRMWTLEPVQTAEAKVLDSLFLVFYIVELSLRASYLHQKMFVGNISRVWWNWMDVIIVATGIIDQWIVPVLFHGESAAFLQYIRALRILRLARLLKIVRSMMAVDLCWAESDAFQAFIMIVIGVNCLIMGLEADWPDLSIWPYVENLLLGIFGFELMVRLKHHGCAFFYGEGIAWNLLDFIIVLGGIVDQWLFPAYQLAQEFAGIHTAHSSSISQALTLLRMLRLVRLLRLVRMIRNIKPLWTLLMGILSAMQGMGWLLVLTLAVIYIVALLCVKLIGHRLGMPDAPDEVVAAFPSVAQSMWWFFMAMNGDPTGMQAVLDYSPLFQLAIAMYMVLTSFAILSVLTGVVCDEMSKVAEAHEEEENAAKSEMNETFCKDLLADIFIKLDVSQTGTLFYDEFHKMLEDDGLCVELCENLALDRKDVANAWEYLSKHSKCDASGEEVSAISREDFIDGLFCSKGVASEREVMRVERRLTVVERKVSQMHNSVAVRMDDINSKLEQLLKQK